MRCVFLLCVFFLGCQSTYFYDRGQDFVDVWRLGLTYGPGALVNVRATKLLQVGFGGVDVFKMGMKGRAYGFWREFRGEGGVSLVYFTHYDKDFISGNSLLREEMAIPQPDAGEEVLADVDPFYGDRNFLEVGFTLHVFFVGVEFALDLYSLLDFLGGWLLLDPQQDDLRTLRKKQRIEEKTARVE